MATYLPNSIYDRLIEKLHTLEPNAVTGNIEPCQIKIALGEFGDIWPEHLHDGNPPKIEVPIIDERTGKTIGYHEL